MRPIKTVLQRTPGMKVHMCNTCKIAPIRKVLYHCTKCDDLDLCTRCYRGRKCGHRFERTRVSDEMCDAFDKEAGNQSMRVFFGKFELTRDVSDSEDDTPIIEDASAAAPVADSDKRVAFENPTLHMKRFMPFKEKWEIYCELAVKHMGATIVKIMDSTKVHLYDQDGKLHTNSEMPSEQSEISANWHTHGLLDRADGPAKDTMGSKQYYKMGKLHCLTGPAVRYIHICGTCPPPQSEFWVDGVRKASIP